MTTAKLKCDNCERMLMVSTGRKGWASILDAGYRAGWKMRNGEWYCGKACIAASAKDVTPLRKQIETHT